MAEEIKADDEKDNIVEVEYEPLQTPERPELAEKAETVAEVETPETVAETPTEKPTETPAAPSHPIDLVAQATQLGIDPEEISGMSTAELRREIRFERRMQQLANSKEHSKPTAEAKKPEEEDPLAGIDREAILPELLGPLEKLAAQNKAAMEEIRSLKQGQQAAVQKQSFEQVQSRVAGVIESIAPGVAAKFNPATKEGIVLHNALFGQLATLERLAIARGQTPSEPDLVRKALAALDMLPSSKETPKEAKLAALEAEKARFDKGALGTPQARQNPAKLLDILKEKKRKENRTAEEVEQFDDVDFTFEPLPG